MVLKHLFGLFRTAQSLDVRHLQAVFEIQGLPFQSASKEFTVAELRPAGLASFRRLRRVYETIRAIEYLLSNLLDQEKQNPPQSSQISNIIINLLTEIDMHSRTPRKFSPRTFDHISRLRSRLNYFLSEHEKSSEKAMTYLQDGTHRIIEQEFRR